MEQRTATISFDLETAKKINIGEIAGRIVTEKGQNRAEIVYEDNSSNCPLLVVIHSISVSADWFSATGKALSSANRLLLEVPEYTTFKDGEVLSNKDGSYIFILNTHGKYLTSFYASLNQKGILKIEDGLSAWENKIEKYRFATESERQKLVDALKASKEPEAKEYLKRFFGIEEKLKYDFKPFDKVLVRIVSKYTALLGQQKLKESFVKDLELVLSRKNPNIEKGKLNFIRYSEMKNWSVRELFGEDLEQADRALINKVYHMLFDIGSDFESVIRMLYSFRNGPKSGIKVADPEDNYEWTNKDGNEKYSTKNLPKAHFRWDWRRYTLSKESVDKITEFVDTILES